MSKTSWRILLVSSWVVVTAAGCGNPSKPGDAGAEGDVPSELDDADNPEGSDDVLDDCVPTGDEVCDGVDNDCDGEIDEDFGLESNVDSCGACGFRCEFPNATPMCVDGVCLIETCLDGFLDVNRLVVDGCEYECTATADGESDDDGTCSDGVDNDCDGRVDLDDPDCSDCYPEYCDEMDNDCDGFIDEDFDLASDPANCGACGTVCLMRPHAIPACVLGECTINCEAGWVNEDLDDMNGCEGTCVPDVPDETLCDGTDADCDGLVDEDYVPYPCGEGACESDSVCWAGVEDCVPRLPLADVDATCDGIDDNCNGDVDEDFVPSDMCIGHCRTTATCVDGAEVCGDPLSSLDTICDGFDDDCDGEVDEEYVVTTCGSGGCVRDSTCIGGVEDCIGGGPAPEICNGSDDDCDTVIDNAPPGDMCPSPPHASPACIGGVCGVGTCDPGWYDINGAPIDGCECTPESTETSSLSCSRPMDLGDLRDTGTTATITGNIIDVGDEDWYTFRAVDTSDTGTTACDRFHVHIEFTANPGNEFKMDVYRAGPYGTGNCDRGGPECSDFRSYDRNMNHRGETIATSPGIEGECNCSYPETWRYNICDNDTDTFWIKVWRPGSVVTCGSYTIVIRNG